jgi:hypothetical protein
MKSFKAFKERSQLEESVLATGSYEAVMKKLYKIDQSAAMARAEIENSNGTHKGKTATYFTTKIAGKYHLTKDKPLTESVLTEAKLELDPNHMELNDMTKINQLLADAFKVGSEDIDASALKNGTKLIASYTKARKLVAQVDAEIKLINKLYS